jgi:CheY-like chemotaxis protein
LRICGEIGASRDKEANIMARALIVDDDHGIRAMLCEILTLEGHQVHTATNGSEALSLLRVTPHSVIVLLGGIMPVMNGFETLDAVMRDERLARQHIYIPMSANIGFPPWAKTRLDIPDLPMLLKPFTADRVLDVVAWAMRRLEVAA